MNGKNLNVQCSSLSLTDKDGVILRTFYTVGLFYIINTVSNGIKMTIRSMVSMT